MENNAMIKIVTVQKPVDGTPGDKIELETVGKFSERDGKFYIKYDETELTGFKNTSTMVKISANHILLSRFGDIESRMEFELGQKKLCNYNTSYGAIPVATELFELTNNLSKSGGTAKFSYNLDFNNEKFAVNTLDISVKTKG